MLHTEQISSGPTRIRIDVETSQPMEWVLDDKTFLDYRLGEVFRAKETDLSHTDLFWDRLASQKDIRFVDNQLRLMGDWAQGEIQKIMVSLIARRLDEKGVYLFHSSSVRYRDTSILFMTGEGNSGKTMSQIEARRRGAAFIATETTMVEGKTKQVLAGSKDVFLIKRAKGTERSDKPTQEVGVQKLFAGELPDLQVYYTEPTKIHRVILPDIDGHFDTAVSELNEFEKSFQTFHCLMNYWNLNSILSPGIPMPILDNYDLRKQRAAFVQEFSQIPYHIIRASTPQLVLDEVEVLI